MSGIIKNQRPSTSSKTTKKKQSYKFKYNTEKLFTKSPMKWSHIIQIAPSFDRMSKTNLCDDRLNNFQ